MTILSWVPRDLVYFNHFRGTAPCQAVCAQFGAQPAAIARRITYGMAICQYMALCGMVWHPGFPCVVFWGHPGAEPVTILSAEVTIRSEQPSSKL
jgi:hypothetical protein